MSTDDEGTSADEVGTAAPAPEGRRRIAIAIAAAVVVLAGGLLWIAASDGADDDATSTGGSTTTIGAGATVRAIDFLNHDYHLSCGALGSYDITVVDGLWEGASTVEPDTELSTSEGLEVVYVDTPGRSDADAVVRVPCSYGANTVVSNILVLRLDPDGTAQQVGATVFGFAPTVTDEPGELLVWNEAPIDDDAGCCPSFYERTTYRIGEDGLQQVDTVTLPSEETPFHQPSGNDGEPSEVPGADGRTVAEILEEVRHPEAGHVTTYLRGAFVVREGGLVRDGVGVDDTVVHHAGFFQNPEVVRVDGVDYAVGTVPGDDGARQLRVARTDDLVVSAGSLSDVRTERIARFDQAGDAYVDAVPIEGYEYPGGGTIVRQFVDESNDVMTTIAGSGTSP